MSDLDNKCSKVKNKTLRVQNFPYNVSVGMVKDFLEGLVEGVTVYALRLNRHHESIYAEVQFPTIEKAKAIFRLGKLYYGTFPLEVEPNYSGDIVKKQSLVATTYFGCQVSTEKFAIFGDKANVVVQFESFVQKVELFVSHDDKDYKLQLSYSNMSEIQRRCPLGSSSQFLIIKVCAAPRIYEKLKCSEGDENEDPDLSYRSIPDDIWHIRDDCWIRTTDFTNSCYIGQSSDLCLELPLSCRLSYVQENFHNYKEESGQFLLDPVSPFYCDSGLVPVVVPPERLPYNVQQKGSLAGPSLNDAFFKLVDPGEVSMECIECALEKLGHVQECCYDPVKWLKELYRRFNRSEEVVRGSVSLREGLVYIRRVQVTPSRVYFCGPEVNVSNRVLRHYERHLDNFIRVSFVDENREKMHSAELFSKKLEGNYTAIYRRILSTMRNGIVISGKKFEFLAFSSSQLKHCSAWMFASVGSTDAKGIRNWMGDFRGIKNVAKYAARLGQALSSSIETLSAARADIEIIPDVEIETNGKKYVFSDGIGKISVTFACSVAKKCGLKGSVPSLFQIRYSGYKGVVAVDPTSQFKLSLRNSMSKFKSTHTELEVLSWSKYQPCFLNRQLVTLLSTLGIQDHVFEKKQKEVVNQLDMILTDPMKAIDTLETMSPGEYVDMLKQMLVSHYMPDAEPFLWMMLKAVRALKLSELQKKTRIFIKKGRAMMGCLDETRTLEYGQVFVHASCVSGKQFREDTSSTPSVEASDEPILKASKQCSYIVQGKVVVAKNPCLHPGDVRVLIAIDVPALHHMVDCVVFPQKGSRPHPDECSGSDLDGDIYFVSWDRELIPTFQVAPMDYTPESTTILDREVKFKEVHEYFTKYLINDTLGVIANAHTVFADKESKKAGSDACIELARLFSTAVDYSKTGVPAVIPSHLRVEEFPDFMEKHNMPTYESQGVIGKLFRGVKIIEPPGNGMTSSTLKEEKMYYDPDMEVDGFEKYLKGASEFKKYYDYKLGNLMESYQINTEAEILFKALNSSGLKPEKDVDAIGTAVRFLRKEARSWFDNQGYDSVSGADDLDAKASAWYHVTYHPDYLGSYIERMGRDHLLSFPWCVYDKLIVIKKRNKKKRECTV